MCTRTRTYRDFKLVAESISTYVVVFPALDAASAYPLNAITLGNSLLNTFRNSPIIAAR